MPDKKNGVNSASTPRSCARGSGGGGSSQCAISVHGVCIRPALAGHESIVSTQGRSISISIQLSFRPQVFEGREY